MSVGSIRFTRLMQLLFCLYRQTFVLAGCEQFAGKNVSEKAKLFKIVLRALAIRPAEKRRLIHFK